MSSLPPPGQQVTVREVGYGGRELTGRVVAGEDGQPLTQEAADGTPMVAFEEADGRTTFVPWLDGQPNLVAYEWTGAPAEVSVPDPQAPVTIRRGQVVMPGMTDRRAHRHIEVVPLTEEELTRETGVRGRIGRRRGVASPPVSSPPLAHADSEDLGDRLHTAALTTTKALNTAGKREATAERAYHRAEAQWVECEPGSAEEAKALAVVQERRRDLGTVQEERRQVAQSAVVDVVAQVTNGGLPSWVWWAVGAAACLVLGPLAVLLMGAIVVSPIRALLTGK